MVTLGVLVLFTIGFVFPCFALEPEPGKWNHLPLGTNFVGVGYGYTEADILFDPALLLEDVEMELHTWAGKYIRTFELFEKSARIDLTQAYQEGEWTGLLDGVQASTSRSGLSDTFLRFAANLYGAPPLSGKEFVAYRSEVEVETIVGMALTVRLPTGDYMEDKLINLGGNRFAFRPQLGVVHTRGKWTTEATGEVAFFTDNDEFFNGKTLGQKPLYIVDGHLIYTFEPGLWIGASFGWDYGGEISVDGVDKDDTKQNIAWALSFAYPINRSSGFKVKYIGTRTREATGFDSNTVTSSLSFMW
ncbi:MAG: transporter [Deltaproteobacteria bacterium]|nr:transporter [Deltaproteobacteria bacterium]